jgi:hypothetical protein
LKVFGISPRIEMEKYRDLYDESPSIETRKL